MVLHPRDEVDKYIEFSFPEIKKLFGMRKDNMGVFWFELGCLRKHEDNHSTKYD